MSFDVNIELHVRAQTFYVKMIILFTKLSLRL